MKIKLTVKEILYHEVEIDTEEYGVNDTDVFEIAEFINGIKYDPKGYLSAAYSEPEPTIDSVSLKEVK